MDGAHTPCLKLALVFEEKTAYLHDGYSEEQCAALTHDGEVQAVRDSLERLGHHVTPVPGIRSLVKLLAAGDYRHWDLVFNMAQGFHGSAREAQVPALLEAYQIPYTFSDAETMTLCQNKAVTKMILDRYMVPNAPFTVIRSQAEEADLPELVTELPTYPLFIKPVIEGSSKGIADSNKIKNEEDLIPAAQKLASRFPGQDILVESFLPGREFTVSILGTGPHCRVIGIREHIYQASTDHRKNGSYINPSLDFACSESKSSTAGKMLMFNDSHDMSDPHIKAVCEVALDAWKVFNCRDSGRVDIRFDSEKPGSTPNVLEVNPIAGLLPEHSPLPASAKLNGLSFDDLLTEIIKSALRRSGKDNTK
ncbi:hypothetical protein N7461_000245 [Penicillium sp. DV-2018c]|nr:hypothetical protein N7461_000245 [Penicillium sp. DV-2018c]